jgi:methyl-accepting chemotaxis protein
MKNLGVLRQLLLLLSAAIAVTLFTALSLFLLQLEIDRLAEMQRLQSEIIFKVINSATRAQGLVQSLLREKDIDLIEKLVGESDGIAAEVRTDIVAAGAEKSPVMAAFERILQANKNVQDTFLRGEQAAAQIKYIEEVNPAFEVLMKEISAFQSSLSQSGDDKNALSRRNIAYLQDGVFIIVALALIGLGYCGWWLRKHIALSLRGVAQTLQNTSDGVFEGSKEIKQASTSLADGASEQAGAIEEVSASLEELESMAQQNSQSLHEAKSLAKAACGTSEAVANEMHLMSGVLNSLQQSGAGLDTSMHEMKESGDAISKIIKTIDEIAFQTNILALNAAVEAARAGEAGAGFAVVAEEVRNLALRSAEAARETSTLIATSIAKSSLGMEVSLRVTTDLKEISRGSRVVSNHLSDIVSQARRLDTHMNSVTESAEQQTHGVKQISQALHQIDLVTHNNASHSEETAGAAEKLLMQAEGLRGNVQALHLLVEGK